jgi:hypothetical protein
LVQAGGIPADSETVSGWANVDVEVLLGDIDTNEDRLALNELSHHPSL